MASKYFRNSRLSIDIQRHIILLLFPGFRCERSRGTLIMTGFLQPTELSVRYHVKMEYKLGYLPKVFVIEPELKKNSENKDIPHTYPGPRPCLYLPKEWSSQMRIGETIIPWLSLWLYYYEIWHATGKWLGEGHLGTKKNTKL